MFNFAQYTTLDLVSDVQSIEFFPRGIAAMSNPGSPTDNQCKASGGWGLAILVGTPVVPWGAARGDKTVLG
eukprot:180614-Prorocentrum_minimum.AAC.1